VILLRHPPATSSSSKHQYVACRGGSTHRCPLPLPLPLPLPSMVDACTAKWSSVSLSLFSFFFLTCRVEADDVYPLTSQVGGVQHQRILKCSKRAREHWLGAGPGGGHTLLECWEPWTSSSSSDIRSKLASVNPACETPTILLFSRSQLLHARVLVQRTDPAQSMSPIWSDESDGRKQSRHDQTG
jgi:hypothetical protein